MEKPINAKKSANINIRTDPKVKKQAEQVYGHYGMTLTQAINAFLIKSVDVGGLPFDLRQDVPNAKTLAAMQEAQDMISGKIPKDKTSLNELFAGIEEEDA